MAWLPTWLGGSTQQTDKPSSSISTMAVPEAPDRLSRAKCWDSRDKFFKCLDKHDILDALKEDEASRKSCSTELQDFEQNCASSWVSLVYQEIF